MFRDGGVTRLVAADEEFDGFVRAASPALLRAAWLLTADWAAAEDLVQSAFERTWPKWPNLADDRQRLAYLYRVVTNGFLHGRRRRWIGEVPVGELPELAVADDTERADMRAALLASIRRLPLRQRTVIALRYLADLSEVRTAEAMRCSLGTVKSYSARGMAALRADPALADLFSEEAKS